MKTRQTVAKESTSKKSAQFADLPEEVEIPCPSCPLVVATEKADDGDMRSHRCTHHSKNPKMKTAAGTDHPSSQENAPVQPEANNAEGVSVPNLVKAIGALNQQLGELAKICGPLTGAPPYFTDVFLYLTQAATEATSVANQIVKEDEAKDREIRELKEELERLREEVGGQDE